MYRKAIFLLLLIPALFSAQANKRTFRQNELGLMFGGSYYIGDLNPRNHFLYSKPAFGIFIRHSKHYRYAFRAGINYGEIYGNDALSKDPNQIERNLSFKSIVVEANGTAEFNFFDYRIGNEHDRFTLFLFAGLGVFYFNPKADLGDGNGYVALRDLKTEGQSKPYSRVQMSVPFGIGFKLNLSQKAGLSMEWGPRRTFTSYLDDVSGTYPSNVSSLDHGKNFTDRTLNSSATPGAMRGNLSTRDWYFFYSITLNFVLPDKKNNTCHGSTGRGLKMKKNFFKQFHLSQRKSIFG